jgi:hypothetical protein
MSRLTHASGLVKTYAPSESGEKQTMKTNNKPLDPSPWAGLRLLSAAAVQGVFVLRP